MRFQNKRSISQYRRNSIIRIEPLSEWKLKWNSSVYPSHIYAPVSVIKIVCSTIQELHLLTQTFRWKTANRPCECPTVQLLYSYFLLLINAYTIFATVCLYFIHVDIGYECIVFGCIVEIKFICATWYSQYSVCILSTLILVMNVLFSVVFLK